MKHLQSYPGLDGDLGQDPIAQALYDRLAIVGSLTQQIAESDCKKNKVVVPKAVKLLNKGKDEIILTQAQEVAKKEEVKPKPSKPPTAAVNNRVSKALDKSVVADELDTSTTTVDSGKSKSDKPTKSIQPTPAKVTPKPTDNKV